MAGRQDMMEPMDVPYEEPLEISARGRDAVEPEELAHEAGIGASGELDALEAVCRAKFSG